MGRLSNPYIFIAVLIVTVAASGALCHLVTADLNNNDFSSVNAVNGSTVVSGDLLIDKNTMRKVPITADPTNLIRPIEKLDIESVLLAFQTGATPNDVIQNDSYITADGHISSDLEGPGTIVVDSEGKLSVLAPIDLVYGYKLPYTIAVKDGDSVNLIQNNTTIDTVKSSDFSNSTIPNDYVGTKSFESWFSTAKDGQNITVDYYLGKFNDNRSAVYGKENIVRDFGEDTYTYMQNYTSGAPVLAYSHDITPVEVSHGQSNVRYLSGYPTEVRAANAREFADGWNNTFIPAHTMAHGKENVTFTSIAESEAASGSATHGVCPAGRSLRAAVLDLGNPMPVGMTTGDESILYEYRPTIDVGVTNDGDYPILIVMWTTGESGDTQVYTTIYELRDDGSTPTNDTATNTTNSTSSSNATT